LIGIGTSKNSDKLDAAVEQAMHSPLLEGNSIKGSKRLMVTLWINPRHTVYRNRILYRQR